VQAEELARLAAEAAEKKRMEEERLRLEEEARIKVGCWGFKGGHFPYSLPITAVLYWQNMGKGPCPLIGLWAITKGRKDGTGCRRCWFGGVAKQPFRVGGGGFGPPPVESGNRQRH
jgi:hypothetical protein